jgi:NAD(P)-dependent dehydrogenase (short-subunit alcohol dehydrogenase family)
MMRC